MAHEKIIVVDDYDSNLKLVKILLRSKNYDIRTAMNEKELYEVLANCHPRLILMDIQLPEKSGLELVEKIRSDPQYQDVIIIAMTAYAMRYDEERAIAAGCDGYIQKPIDIHTLPNIIANYLKSGRKIE